MHLRITPEMVAAQRDQLRNRDTIPVLINDVRDRLGPCFDVTVDHVSHEQYRSEVETVFADGDRAVNVTALVRLLEGLDCAGDYPGFVVDEFLGRKLAATIAGGEPRGLLAEATFHFADVHIDDGPSGVAVATGETAASPDAEPAGADDLDAALAAGFQTRLPGWGWTETDSPFSVE
ncbi:MAG: hypothetical protein PPP58_11655 [Natronomonas sp.]